MATRGRRNHFASLNGAGKTRRERGAAVMTKYKETTRGGSAVNIVKC